MKQRRRRVEACVLDRSLFLEAPTDCYWHRKSPLWHTTLVSSPLVEFELHMAICPPFSAKMLSSS